VTGPNLDSRLQVRFSTHAVQQLAGLHRRRRGTLKREMEKVASSAPNSRSSSPPDRRLVHVRTAMDVAAGEVIGDGKVLLVYAVLSRQELLERIWGPGVDRRVRSRRLKQIVREMRRVERATPR
jgi:hypothetical protein